jgi:hypothetical protein
LELAVEVAPGAWVDLALQAKKFNPATGKYDGWKTRQNRMLVRWARANGRRAAGMLLYNSSDPPFAPPGQASSVFNLCCSYTVCHGWRWPTWQWPDGRSPLAISLILDISDPRVARLSNPTPQRIADLALPLECLFCPSAHSGALATVIGTRPAWVEPLEAELLQVEPQEAELRQGPLGDELSDAEARQQDANYSLVLGMSDAERDEYNQSAG